MNDKVEREMIINAPIETVWRVITKTEHVANWLSSKAEYEVAPGSKGKLSWDSTGEAPLTIVTVDEPNEFSFRWVAADEETRSINGETLVRFTLNKEGEATKLRVEESGFEKLALNQAQKDNLRNKHMRGWAVLLGNAKEYVSKLDKDEHAIS